MKTRWMFVTLLTTLCGLIRLPTPTEGRARSGNGVGKEKFDGSFLSDQQNDERANSGFHGKNKKDNKMNLTSAGDGKTRMVSGSSWWNNLRSIDAEGLRRNWPSWRRVRREVYGTDERQEVGEFYMRRHPFSAMVRVSPGCSGMLVSRHHVLTAAHCLYDLQKNSYREKIRVGVPIPENKRSIPSYLTILRVPRRSWPEAVFYKMHDVQRADVPYSWIANSRHAPRDDFGLITLKPTSCIKKPYLKLQGFGYSSFRSLINLGDETLSFGAFEDDYPRGMLSYRTCNIERVDSDSLLYLRCDAAPGSSGAGIYSHVVVRRNGRITTRRRLIGVFSGNRAHPQQNRNGAFRRYNVAIGITPARLRLVCRWAPELCQIPDWRDRKGVKLWLLGCNVKKANHQKQPTKAPPTASRPPSRTSEPSRTANFTTDRQDSERNSASNRVNHTELMDGSGGSHNTISSASAVSEGPGEP